MSYYEKSLVVVICESFLEERIIEVAKNQGIKGYTILEARGEGARGHQGGEFDFDKNIKMEFLCSTNTADQLIKTLHDQFFEDYAIIAYKINVDVLRNEKFS